MKQLWERLLRAPMGLGMGLGLGRQGKPTPAVPSEWSFDSTTATLDSTAYTFDGSAP